MGGAGGAVLGGVLSGYGHFQSGRQDIQGHRFTMAVALFYWTCLSGYNSPQIWVSNMCLKGEANMNSEPPPDLPEIQIDEVVQGVWARGKFVGTRGWLLPWSTTGYH